jgi:alanine dehydrogenase
VTDEGVDKMYTLRVLDAKQVKTLIKMDDVIPAVEEAYKLYSKGEAGLFPVIIHEFEPGKNDMDIKSGHLWGGGIYGLKILGWCKDNPKQDLPALSGLIVLMEIKRQQPIGIIDASPITFLRTGAAGAIGAKVFARKDSSRAVIIGSGMQGRAQLQGLSITMPVLKEIHFFDKEYELACKLVSEQQQLFPSIALYAHPFSELENKLKKADIVVTCTTSRNYFIERDWIQPGTHINAIGCDMPGKQELEPSLVASAKVFADSIAQVTVKGECQWAYSQKMLKEAAITEIGQVLLQEKEGRCSDDEITVFDATGMAIQDLITAKKALDQAKTNKIGSTIHMMY